MTTTAKNDTDASDLLATLQIMKVERRQCGGRWVMGTIGDGGEPGRIHRFQALVFMRASEPEMDGYEMGHDTGVSKLWRSRGNRIQLAPGVGSSLFSVGGGVYDSLPVARPRHRTILH